MDWMEGEDEWMIIIIIIIMIIIIVEVKTRRCKKCDKFLHE